MWLLPWFMEQYKPFVHQFVIFDDGSSDDPTEYLRSHANATVIESNRKDRSYIEQSLEFWNNKWKEVRNEADWIKTCNIDEHVYHPDIHSYLDQCRHDGVTLIPATDYEMVSGHFPATQGRLCDEARFGSASSHFIGNSSDLDKIMVFNPKAIDEINFTPGRHWARPLGNSVVPSRQELKMLHFKYIGF